MALSFFFNIFLQALPITGVAYTAESWPLMCESSFHIKAQKAFQSWKNAIFVSYPKSNFLKKSIILLFSGGNVSYPPCSKVFSNVSYPRNSFLKMFHTPKCCRAKCFIPPNIITRPAMQCKNELPLKITPVVYFGSCL